MPPKGNSWKGAMTTWGTLQIRIRLIRQQPYHCQTLETNKQVVLLHSGPGTTLEKVVGVSILVLRHSVTPVTSWADQYISTWIHGTFEKRHNENCPFYDGHTEL